MALTDVEANTGEAFLLEVPVGSYGSAGITEIVFEAGNASGVAVVITPPSSGSAGTVTVS